MFRVFALWLVIIGVGGFALWEPDLGHWLTHEGYPVVFGVIGSLAIIGAIVRLIRFRDRDPIVVSYFMIGLGAMAFTFGHVIGQAVPMVGAVVIVAGIVPCSYGLFLQRRKGRSGQDGETGIGR